MSEKSPYREAGISASARPNRKPEPSTKGLWSGVRDMAHRAASWGHLFNLSAQKEDRGSKRGTLHRRYDLDICERCKKPRFAVETYQCRGRK